MIIYTVKQGDSLFKIAERYDVSPERLISVNNLSTPSKLLVGQSLIIPSMYRNYFVENGDSIYSISRNFDVSWQDVVRINSLREPFTIYPGQELLIPPSSAPKKVIETNGYAYENISDNTIVRMAPYLTYLTVFSYKITDGGNLISPNDERIIRTAKQNNIAPVMAVTNTSQSGGFNSDTVSEVLRNNTLSNTLIDNIVNTAKQKGYRGVNIDFEYIPPSDRENYNSFLGKLFATLKTEEILLSTAVAPKVKSDQSGLLYEAHDYKAHGENTDYIIIMTYEWGYLYGPPMAVSPINEIERVLQYAVSETDSSAVMMSLPNYGYDWTLPYRRGRAARVLNLNQAFDLALSENVQIEFNETSASPFFEYTNGGVSHIVWFDDARSFYQKAELISKYNLLGVSFWSVNSFYPQVWEILGDMYDIKKIQ